MNRKFKHGMSMALAVLSAMFINTACTEDWNDHYDDNGTNASRTSILDIVKTDAVTVGEALLENGLIAGEDGDYGLYVKTVCGITADYDVDKTYWAFYINGEYAMSGVDKTDIADGAVYEFKIEK